MSKELEELEQWISENVVTTIGGGRIINQINLSKKMLQLKNDIELQSPPPSNSCSDPVNKDYYLTKTENNKWAIAYWDGVKFWDDPNQDGKLTFGVRRDFIKEWYSIPLTQPKGYSDTIKHLKEVGNFIDVSLTTAKETSMLFRLKDLIASKVIQLQNIERSQPKEDNP